MNSSFLVFWGGVCGVIRLHDLVYFGRGLLTPGAFLQKQAFIRHVLIDYDHEHHPHIHDKAHVYHCLDHSKFSFQHSLLASLTVGKFVLLPSMTRTFPGEHTLTLLLVRQALLCHADTTLEPTGSSRDYSHDHQHYLGSQGGGRAQHMGHRPELGVHMCKNWSAVRTWIEDNGMGQRLQ